MSRSFLQTEEWLKFQESIGHKTWRFDDGQIKANIIQHKISLGKNYLYIPHGPEIFFDSISGGLKNEVNNFLRYLKELGKENKSIFVKMEPISDLVMETMFQKGIKRSGKQFQPHKTVVVNLKLSEDELLSRMHHKTRYNIRLAEKKKLEFRESGDLEQFWQLLKRTAKKDRFSTHPKDYYKKLLKFFIEGKELRTELFFVDYESKSIAGAIVLFYGDTAYYLHGAMDRDYKDLMAPYFLHWSIIKHAKSTGNNHYDFWGIDAQKWPGVTRFKLGWGGDVKEYPGSFDIPISKFWYFTYNLARKIF